MKTSRLNYRNSWPNIGDKFHHLTMVSEPFFLSYLGKNVAHAEFRCRCGNIVTRQIRAVKGWQRKSCGCWLRRSTNFNVIHGKANRLYNIWKHLRRNGRPRHSSWKVFSNFEKWAYRQGYNDDLKLVRINKKLGFSPKNCEFKSCR